MTQKITKRVVDATEAAEKPFFLWDSEVKGFGLKVNPSGKRVYVLQYRILGRGTARRFTIGIHGSPWTPETARKEAVVLLGEIEKGHDPASQKAELKNRKTVSELCDQYLEEGCATKKASTLATDKGRIERHIKPLLGKQFIEDVTPNDVRRFMNDIASGKTAADVKTGKFGRARVTGGKGTAARTVGLLGGIFSFAFDEGLVESNPVRGVKRFTDKKAERFLSPAEIAQLGDILAEVEDNHTEHPFAVAVIRLLILTGCRKSEILALKWSEIDFERSCLRLEESKTGSKTVTIGAAALEILANLPRSQTSPYVFPALRGGGHYVGVPKAWTRIKKRAGLEDVRLHDLRHSFVSVGVSAGMGLPLIGRLVGHKDAATTSRYAHLADDPAKTAADRISSTIAASLIHNRTEATS